MRADAFIRELAAGHETVVEQRGVKLSGGQRQLVVSEYALALVLAVGAGLVMRTFANLEVLDRVVSGSIAQPRLLASLLLGFSALALSLGAIGLYGVVACGAAQRTREFGVRIALGARAGEVLGLVARDELRPVAVGVAIGLVGALALSRVLESQLYEVEPIDPVEYASAAGVLALAALVAALKPAWRATRTDPIVATEPTRSRRWPFRHGHRNRTPRRPPHRLLSVTLADHSLRVEIRDPDTSSPPPDSLDPRILTALTPGPLHRDAQRAAVGTRKQSVVPSLNATRSLRATRTPVRVSR